jgi:L-lactate dehydrogenase complex protein LldG
VERNRGLAVNRDEFLERVRKAVAEGNQVGRIAAFPARGNVGYQGAGDDPAERFRDNLIAAGGRFHSVDCPDTAVDLLLTLLRERNARKILLGPGRVLERLDLQARLVAAGFSVTQADLADREASFAADVGISGVDHLIAETGSVVMESRPDQPRGLTLLPPLHIAIADRSQLVPDLFDLYARLDPQSLPACIALITGPSKTGDIELKLVTGVHGPGAVHVVLLP